VIDKPEGKRRSGIGPRTMRTAGITFALAGVAVVIVTYSLDLTVIGIMAGWMMAALMIVVGLALVLVQNRPLG
jgi:hypothetical protein